MDASTSKHRLVIISPDSNTDYCYLDMSEEEAIAEFKQNEDWLEIYQPTGYVPKAITQEVGNSFMLWRNKGADMAAQMEARGMPPEFAALFRGREK